MEKPKRRRTDNVIVVPDALAATMTDRDIAQRAYELYLQRGNDHGHDIIDDWLQENENSVGRAASPSRSVMARRNRKP
jgi:hypothetical protein